MSRYVEVLMKKEVGFWMGLSCARKCGDLLSDFTDLSFGSIARHGEYDDQNGTYGVAWLQICC
jgi:hypothetical protein